MKNDLHRMERAVRADMLTGQAVPHPDGGVNSFSIHRTLEVVEGSDGQRGSGYRDVRTPMRPQQAVILQREHHGLTGWQMLWPYGTR